MTAGRRRKTPTASMTASLTRRTPLSFQVPSTVYPTWNSLPISALIRPRVHRWSPANPCASGPRLSSASSRANCCGLSRSRDTGPLDRGASVPPSRQARRHRHTGPSVTRRSRAIWLAPSPRRKSSQRRRGRATLSSTSRDPGHSGTSGGSHGLSKSFLVLLTRGRAPLSRGRCSRPLQASRADNTVDAHQPDFTAHQVTY